MKIRHQIAELYGAWLPNALLELDPRETKATCDSCAMAPSRHRGKTTYREDLKCCTYQPWLPNYIVGAILSDERDSNRVGREAILKKISRREYTLPIGIFPPVRYQVEFNQRAEGEFGWREDWLCPYFNHEAQNCGLWRHRGSVCTSYYCKSDQKAAGKRFWKSLESYLHYVEMALAEEVLAHLDFSPRQVSEMLDYMNRQEGTVAELRSWVMPAAKFKKLWNFYEDPVAFYKKTYEIAKAQSREDVELLMGDLGDLLRETVLVDMRCFQ